MQMYVILTIDSSGDHSQRFCSRPVRHVCTTDQNSAPAPRQWIRPHRPLILNVLEKVQHVGGELLGFCRNEKWLSCGCNSSPALGIARAMSSVLSRLIASSRSASTIQVGTVMPCSSSAVKLGWLSPLARHEAGFQLPWSVGRDRGVRGSLAGGDPRPARAVQQPADAGRLGSCAMGIFGTPVPRPRSD